MLSSKCNSNGIQIHLILIKLQFVHILTTITNSSHQYYLSIFLLNFPFIPPIAITIIAKQQPKYQIYHCKKKIGLDAALDSTRFMIINPPLNVIFNIIHWTFFMQKYKKKKTAKGTIGFKKSTPKKPQNYVFLILSNLTNPQLFRVYSFSAFPVDSNNNRWHNLW